MKLESKVIVHSPCYLSGPMQGIEGFNRVTFNVVDDLLTTQLGLVVVNPARLENPKLDAVLDGFPALSREFCLQRDVSLLMLCNSIVMLPDWQKSRGACMELAIANELDLDLYAVEMWPEEVILTDLDTGLSEAEKVFLTRGIPGLLEGVK